VNDGRIEKLVLIQFAHRTEQYGISTALRCPAPEDAVNAGGDEFRNDRLGFCRSAALPTGTPRKSTFRM